MICLIWHILQIVLIYLQCTIYDLHAWLFHPVLLCQFNHMIDTSSCTHYQQQENRLVQVTLSPVRRESFPHHQVQMSHGEYYTCKCRHHWYLIDIDWAVIYRWYSSASNDFLTSNCHVVTLLHVYKVYLNECNVFNTNITQYYAYSVATDLLIINCID